MALHFTTTDQSALNGVKVLVHGPSGIGKTRLCATAPKPIILSAESGLLSLREYKIPVMEINTVEDLIEAHQWFLTNPHAKQFETVCLDSISEMGEKVLANAKKQVKDPRQAYGELIDKMTATVKAFRDLDGFNVYMAAKTEGVKDEISGAVLWGPSMPGTKMGPALPYLFDEVFAFRKNKTQQGVEYTYLQTSRDLQYEAKDRSGSLDLMEEPNLTKIFNKIRGVK